MAFKFLGKLLVIAAIFIVGHHDIYAGIALVLCIILLDKNTSLIEGMENKDDDGADSDSKSDGDSKSSHQAVPSFKSNGVAAIGKSQDATSTSKVANQGKGQQQANSICDDCIGDGDLPEHCSKCPCNGTPCKDSNLSDVDDFKSKYCVHGKLMKDDKEISVDDISSAFPEVKYVDENDKCNVCSDDCKFDIVHSNEQLHTEENIRSSDSNKVQVDHKKAVTSEEAPEAY
tara:strand:- start:309 stop:998 length:690 start_codon:yes stop_codon:yes gene_type:complete